MAAQRCQNAKEFGRNFSGIPKYAIFAEGFQKSFSQIPWRSDFTGLPSFLHVKRLQGTTDTPGYDKKNIGSNGTKSCKG
jgi:hypothetical protein